MSLASKFFGIVSFFLITTAIVLASFQDMSLFSFTPRIIAEERLVAIGMLLSVLAFIIISSREIERRA